MLEHDSEKRQRIVCRRRGKQNPSLHSELVKQRVGCSTRILRVFDKVCTECYLSWWQCGAIWWSVTAWTRYWVEDELWRCEGLPPSSAISSEQRTNTLHFASSRSQISTSTISTISSHSNCYNQQKYFPRISPVTGAAARLALLATVKPRTLSSFTWFLVFTFSSFFLLRVLNLLTWGAPPFVPPSGTNGATCPLSASILVRLHPSQSSGELPASCCRAEQAQTTSDLLLQFHFTNFKQSKGRSSRDWKTDLLSEKYEIDKIEDWTRLHDKFCVHFVLHFH